MPALQGLASANQHLLTLTQATPLQPASDANGPAIPVSLLMGRVLSYCVLLHILVSQPGAHPQLPLTVVLLLDCHDAVPGWHL